MKKKDSFENAGFPSYPAHILSIAFTQKERLTCCAMGSFLTLFQRKKKFKAFPNCAPAVSRLTSFSIQTSV
jgi:hypothetical protein